MSTDNNINISHFIRTTANIRKSKERGDLYLKKFEEGELKEKKGWKKIKAVFGHFFHWITGRAKIKLKERYQRILKNCFEEYSDPALDSWQNHEIRLKISDLKITNLVLKKLPKELTNERPEYKQKVQEYIQNKQKQIEKDFVPKEAKESFQRLFTASEWEEIKPKQIKKLSEKLSKGKNLTNKEKLCLDLCIKLKPKIEAFNQSLEKVSDIKKTKLSQIMRKGTFNELASITKTVDQFKEIYIKKAMRLHKMYNEKWASIDIEKGKPMPYQLQLKRAFEMAFNKLPLLMGNRKTEEIRAFAARCIQTIMLGKEVGKVPYPEDDVCFTFQEAKDIQNFIPMKLPDFSSYSQWNLMPDSNEGLKKDLANIYTDLFSETKSEITRIKDFNEENNKKLEKELSEEKKDLKKLLDKQNIDELEKIMKAIVTNPEPDRIREVLSELTKICNNTGKKTINNFNDEKLTEIRKKYLQSRQKIRLSQFCLDYPRSTTAKVKNNSFILLEGKEGELPMFLEKLRDEHYQYLVKQSNEIQNIIDTNAKHSKVLGIPEDFTEENFKNLFPKTVEKTILDDAKFTDQQLTVLSNLSNQEKENISRMYRIKLLELFMSFNQATQGIDPEKFDKSQTETFMVQRASTKLESGITATGSWTFDPSLNQIYFDQKWSLFLPRTSVFRLLIIPDNLASYEEESKDKCTYATFNNGVDIHSIVPDGKMDENKGHATYTNHRNLKVSPNAVNILDKIVNTFKVQKKP